MVKRRKASIVREVKLSLKEINLIGISKKGSRERKVKGIHSYKQWEHTLSASQNFVKWVRREFEIRYIKDLTLLHYEAYISFLEKENRSVGHRRNVETALRLLQVGVAHYLKKRKIECSIFVSQKRLTDWRQLEKPKNRSYLEVEYLQILQNLSIEATKAVKIMWHLGLRLKECANVRVEHFKYDASLESWNLIIENGQGVTKGGRFRITPVSKDFEEELKDMLKDKSMETNLIKIKYATIRHAVYTACLKANISQSGRGCHGFRHSYVRNRMREEFKELGLEKEAQIILDKIFINRNLNRGIDYGIHAKQKIVYEQIRKTMNTIHSEIGHGEDRWDLAEVYMKGELGGE